MGSIIIKGTLWLDEAPYIILYEFPAIVEPFPTIDTAPLHGNYAPEESEWNVSNHNNNKKHSQWSTLNNCRKVKLMAQSSHKYKIDS